MLSKSAAAELDALLPDDFPDLGDADEVFSESVETPRGFLLSGAGLIVFGLVFLAGAVFVQPGNKDDGPIMRGILGTLAAGLIGGGGVAIALGLRRSGKRFEFGNHWVLCERGLILVKEAKPRAYKWDQLEVWLDVVITEVTVGIHHTYTLRGGPKRKKLPLPPAKGGVLLSAQQRLMHAVQKRQVAALVPGHLKRVAAGEGVRLGAFTLTKDAVSVLAPGELPGDGQTWRWKEVAGFNYQYDTKAETISLQVQGKPARDVPVSRLMPDLWLFHQTVCGVCPRVGATVKKPERYLI